MVGEFLSKLQKGGPGPPAPGVIVAGLIVFSKIQLVVYYQCCDLIGWATTRLLVIAH